jgi:glycosyltransferase involved in cell wall biosynthesis
MPDSNSATGRRDLAAVILTRNEALDIAECVKSCVFADNVIVLDSHSTDETVRLAREAGAIVHTRAFTDYADQRNAALTLAAQYRWVLMMDADERVPADMAAEVRTVCEQAPEATAAYRLRRKDFFFGRWLRRATGYPTWAARLLRPTRVRFVRSINETLSTDGDTGYLQTHFHHFPFSKGIAAWVDRHNSYSTMEAARLLEERTEPLAPLRITLWDPASRRAFLKRLFYRLPCRPWVAFFSLFFLRRGILDGLPGLYYCRLRAFYEYLIDLKMRELRAANRPPLHKGSEMSRAPSN